MKLLYISAARLPSEMAHGLQISQNCEAFAANGAAVHLWYARRGKLNGAADLWAFYGVKAIFKARKIPSVNLHAWLEGRAPSFIVALAFYMLLASFGFAAGIGAWFLRPDIIYCRDPLPLLVAGWLNPRRKIIWEAHSLKTSGRGTWMQRRALRRASLTVAVTTPLRRDLLKLAPDAQIMVAQDGIRAERFANAPDKTSARAQVQWPQETFIVGYVGRLTTYNMTKGVDTLIAAVAALPERDSVAIALVGGPDDIAAKYRAHWESLGLPPTNFLYAGQVAPDAVPRYLAAFDICAMPFPATEHFANYASPLKLFEYMASGRALVASDLPSWADVITDDHNALLVAPDAPQPLSEAIARLKSDPALRDRLASQAQRDVLDRYTWSGRAREILSIFRREG